MGEHEPDDLPDDPFADLTLDDDFVRAAFKNEPSAAARSVRAAQAREAHEALERRRRGDARRGRRRRQAGSRMARLRSSAPVVAFVLVAVAIVWWDQRAAGVEQGEWLSGDEVDSVIVDDEQPTPQPAASSTPLGTPPSVDPDAGPHRFLATQPGGDEPIAYDPCRPIAVVVNDRTAPPEGAAIVAEALAQMTAATGLQFDVEGPTDERARADRSSFQPDRYGDRWAPVLVAWSDPAEVPELEGTVVGIGGSDHLEAGGGDPGVYVSGIVALDGPDLRDLLVDDPAGADVVRSVVLHELGHLVGLGHVEDDRQLMHAEGRPDVLELRAGDLAGLARLGAGACLDQL